MDNIWLKIGSIVLIGTMLFFLYPRAKHWLKNGPRAQQGDWMAALIPLLLMVGFVILLVKMV